MATPQSEGGQSPRHSAEASRPETATARGRRLVASAYVYILPGYMAQFFQDNALEGPKNHPVVELLALVTAPAANRLEKIADRPQMG